ncbi:MAG: holo-ACP synthase [Lentisphaerota bacterium]
MISGLGTDIVQVSRIREMTERYGEPFLEKVFSDDERKEAARRRDPSQYYAGRWALKEAMSKAMGCGIGEKCGWKDVSTRNLELGKPEAILSGPALETASALGVTRIHISLSHEQEYACATVILENC